MAGEEPEKKEGAVKKKMNELKEKMQSEQVTKSTSYITKHWIEFATGALMILGIIFAFFYMYIGGILVGLAIGFCLFDEIHNYFVQLRDCYSERGLFKTLMVIGVALYLLIIAPAFLISLAAGFGLMTLICWSRKRQG